MKSQGNERNYNLLDHVGQKFYTLSFKGKKIYNAIDIINQAEGINIENYPQCMTFRVADPMNDEDLLNEAVKRVIKEIRKIKK